jgi:hypothetical protein
MIPRLSHYLDRLYTTIHSRREIEVEEFCIVDRSDVFDRTSELFARLRFWDGSLLQVEEALIAKRFTIIKVRYPIIINAPMARLLCVMTMPLITPNCLAFRTTNTRLLRLNPPNRRI